MYAIIQTGGKQYRVEAGDVLDVELDASGEGDSIEFEEVLLVGEGESVRIGAPLVENARVSASLLDDVRGPKLLVFKKKRRKGYKKLAGHRQNLLRVRIDEIQGGA
jgi:large subunit ribosomal protein L21